MVGRSCVGSTTAENETFGFTMQDAGPLMQAGSMAPCRNTGVALVSGTFVSRLS